MPALLALLAVAHLAAALPSPPCPPPAAAPETAPTAVPTAIPDDGGPRIPRPAGATRAAPSAVRDTVVRDTVVRDTVVRDTVVRRLRAVEYSDAYGTRLTIHRWASWAELPLFAASYAMGNRLTSGRAQPGWVRPTHVAAAAGVGTLFAVNTVTGVWNLWDARRDPHGRTRRWLHAALMLGADAGFAYTGTIADDARTTVRGQRRHRGAALAAMATAGAGTALMWLWKD
jgi:hypothetical protein